MLLISDARYNQYETGKRTPDDELKKQIANFYDVSVDYLIGNSGNPNFNNINDNTQKLSLAIHDLLIDKGIITKDEELTEEKIEWLQKLLGHAIDLSKLQKSQ